MENTKVNRRDHCTCSKHLNVHQSLYTIPFAIKQAETIQSDPREPDIFKINSTQLFFK